MNNKNTPPAGINSKLFDWFGKRVAAMGREKNFL